MKRFFSIRVLAFVFIGAFLLLIAFWKSADERIQDLKQDAAARFEEKDYAGALACWNKLLEYDNQAPEVYSNIGDAYLHLAEYESALKAYEKSLAINPDDTSVLLQLGKVHLLRWDVISANKVREKLLPLMKDHYGYHEFYGDIHVLDSDLSGAESEYRKSLDLNPDHNLVKIKLAACLYMQDKTQDAQAVYESLAATAPTEPLVYEQMGSYWKLAADNGKAETMYLKAVALAPKDMHFKLSLAEFYFENEQFEKVIRLFEPFQNKRSLPIACRLIVVESLLGIGNTERAGAELAEIIKDRPNDIEVQLLNSKYLLMSQNPIEAITNLDFVINQEPKLVLAHYLLGIAYLAAGHNKLGHKSLIEALSLDNSFTDAELALADYYFKEGEYDIALEHASRIATREPHHFRAQLILGNVHLSQKRYDQALVCFQKAHMIRPDDISPVYFAALAAERKGTFKEADQLYRTILERAPEMIDVPVRYADLLIKNGKVAAAKDFFLERLEASPKDNGLTEYILGKIFYALDEPDSAKKYFEASVAKNPGNSASYIWIARLCDEKNDTAAKIEVLRSALVHKYQLPEVYLELASAFIQKGDAASAIQILSKAVKVYPDHPLIQNNLSVLYLNRDENLNKAFDLAQSAFQSLPDQPFVNDTLGWAYFKKGLLKQGEWYIREALRLAENQNAEDKLNGTHSVSTQGLAISRYHLGVVLHGRGEDLLARENLKIAIEAGLDGEYLKDAKRILTETASKEIEPYL